MNEHIKLAEEKMDKALQKADACPHGRCPNGIDRTAFQRIRQKIRLGQIQRGAAGAPLHQRTDLDTPVGHQQPRARRSVQALMSGGTENMESILQRNRQNAADLGAVSDAADTPLPAQLCQGTPGQHLSGHVAGKGEYHSLGA